MRLRLLVLLAGIRFRLAPRWLRAQPRRRPVHTAAFTLLLPLILAAVLAVILPGHGRICHHVVAKVPGRVHLICAKAVPGAR